MRQKCLLLLCLLIAALSACSDAPETRRPLDGEEASEELEGTFGITVGDDFTNGKTWNEYFVEAKDGSHTALEFDEMPALESGARIRVTGRSVSPSILRVRSVTELAAAPVRSKASALTAAAAQKKVAVIMVNFQNDTREPHTATLPREAVFTSLDSASAYYAEQTYGQFELVGHNAASGDIFGWYTLPVDNAPCSFGSWMLAAQTRAQADGFDTNNYDHVILWIPYTTTCDFGGMANIAGRNSIINWPVTGSPRDPAAVVAHELGHNFGAYHSSSWRCGDDRGVPSRIGYECTHVEYGDPFCVMGMSGYYRHMNAYQKQRLGWLPDANVRTITTTGTYTIQPIETALTGFKALKIPRGNFTYYVDFRQPVGRFDNFAPTDPAVRGVSIRLASESARQGYLLDMTPSDEPNDSLAFGDAPLLAGQTYTDAAFGISITVQSVSSAGATVRVVPADGDGNGLRGEIFQDSELTTMVFPRTSNVNFDWGPGSPHASIEPETFSMRWTGHVRPRYSQRYTFTTNTDDGVRLWINGTRIIDDWTSTGVRQRTGRITLTAGTLYTIRMEYYENTGNASAKLWWQSTSQAKEIVPSSRLRAPDVNCNWEDDATFCARLGKNCGTVGDLNNCAYYYETSCGACTAPQTCGGGGVPNVCGP